jgi:DNA-binding Xre family transcriptional regulator
VPTEENPDPWQVLEQYRARSKAACDRLDDAMTRLDATAERESKAELEDLFTKVYAVLEDLQTCHPEDPRIRDALERFDRLQEQLQRPPRALLAADAKRILKRLETITNPAMDPPMGPGTPVPLDHSGNREEPKAAAPDSNARTARNRRQMGETVAAFIDRVCASRRWTVAQLAYKSGVNESQIYRLKTNQGVHTTTLNSIATALDCFADDLLPTDPAHS